MEPDFGFKIVRRGYDRQQVAETVTRLVGQRDEALRQAAELEHGRLPDLGSPADESPAGRTVGFEFVRRGYDRAQVDERLVELVEERERALARLRALRSR